jgi:hypothetical protein
MPVNHPAFRAGSFAENLMSEKFHALLLAVKAIVEIDEVTVDAETDAVGTFIPLDKIDDLQNAYNDVVEDDV